MNLIRSRNYLSYASTYVYLGCFGGVRAAHLSSFLCCAFCEVRAAHLSSFLCCAFGEVRAAHLSSFLCCVVFLCFVCLRPVSCVLNVASVSEWSIYFVAPSVCSNVYLKVWIWYLQNNSQPNITTVLETKVIRLITRTYNTGGEQNIYDFVCWHIVVG
jgi:hypothetical protein